LKVCIKCKQRKSSSDFYRNRTDCRLCRKQYQKEFYIKHIDLEKEKRKVYYQKNCQVVKNYQKLRRIENPDIDTIKNLKKYGLSLEQYKEMSLKQNNTCAICNSPETATLKKNGKIKKLSVDHNHITNKIRGLLCINCNRGIGSFKDDVEKLKRAILYLEQSNA